MKIIHRYILNQLIRNFFICLMIFSVLFILFDFFDRVDVIMSEGTSFWIALKYFLYKIPLTLNLMIPISMLIAAMFTIGMLSKNSEITAMRAGGLTLFWIAKPLFAFALAVCFFSILFQETIVPHAQRRVREIYAIDIRKKDERGGLSQTDFWWRSGDNFYSIEMFDSRTNTLHALTTLEVEGNSFDVTRRTDAKKATWVTPELGWTMNNVEQYDFSSEEGPDKAKHRKLPLPIEEEPKDFFKAKMDPNTMSYFQLREFIHKQQANGISIIGYLSDLYSKLSFAFVTFVVTLVALPFALKPARSGSMAVSLLAGMIIGFSYYAVHSFSIAMGRAELWPPLLAAWTANILMCIVGGVLNWGAESPH